MDTSGGIRFPAIILILFIALLISMVVLPPGGNNARAASGWQAQTSGTTEGLLDIDAVDVNTAWTVGWVNTVLKTENGGTTWVDQHVSIPGSIVIGVSALDKYTAWVVGAGGILKTTDGGKTWVDQTPDLLPVSAIQMPYLYGVKAVDDKHVWVSGSEATYEPDNTLTFCAKIIKTTDGGTTWTTSYSEPGSQCLRLAAASQNVVWVASQNGLLKTVDGGGNWTMQSTGAADAPTSISALDVNRGWMTSGENADGRGEAFVTGDGGNSWNRKFSSAINTMLSDVSTPTAAVTWATSSGSYNTGGKILKTTDGGSTWYLQNYGTGPLSAISAVNPSVAWAVGAEGTILHTTDGGGIGRLIPRIDSISPQEASAGAVATIKGAGFGATQGTSYVNWDGLGEPPGAEITSWSDTQIKFKVPPIGNSQPQTDQFTVIQPLVVPAGQDASSSNGVNFTILPGPTVTAINPKTGVNTTKYAVEVLGSDFQATSKVRLQKGTTVINGIGVVLAKPGRLTCYLDLKSKPLGKYDVYVTNPDGGEAKLAGGFTIVNICGQGAAASISVFAGLLGLLSMAGLGWRRKHR